MPWKVHKRGNKYCVIKEGERAPVPGGCHDTQEQARAHQKALYAGEASSDATMPLMIETTEEMLDQIRIVEFGGIPPHSTAMVDRPWDGPSQVAKLPNPVGRTKARQMYAWVNSNGNPDVKASYHFPHHEVNDAGEVGPANMAGVRIGLARVPRANIPDSERAGARAHLQRHLDDWHKQQQAVDEAVEHLAEQMSKPLSPVAQTWSGGSGMSTAENTVQLYDSTGQPIGWAHPWSSGNGWTTWTVTTDSTAEQTDTETDAPTWEGVLAVEGLPTTDGRYLMPGKIGHRDLPLTLMAQTVTADGHEGAFVAGKITKIWREDRPDLGKDAVAIMGSGVFSQNEDGQRAQSLLEEEVLRGVSIDFAPSETHMLDPQTHEIVDDQEMDLMDLLGGKFLRGFEGDIMGATLCPFQAFEDATMQIVETPEKVVVASAFPVRRVLTASAAGLAPLAPPYDWFFEPEHDGPTPLTVTPEGQVYGHLATWDQCHRSMRASCELAPRSRSGYAYFHTGALTTEDGRKVNVGRITVGDGGHASVSPYLGTEGAVEHYDKTGTVGAFVRATDGRHGIWLSGAVRSDCPAEKVRDMEANPPSGDWREEKGRLELCAALSVPVAGFPVPRYEAALVASGTKERVVALVASGYSESDGLSRADQRRFEMLKVDGRFALEPIDASAWSEDGSWLGELESEDFQEINAEQRRRAAQTGAALPDGSFPILKCRGDGPSAENAIRAQGRAAPGKRGRVRAHIRKRVRSLGCSGGIFDPYR